MSDAADLAVYEEGSERVRFWVRIGERVLGASIGRYVLHHHFCPSAQNDDPLDTFKDHEAEIEATARRRFAEGSIEPVMLREHDLRTQALLRPD